MDGFIRVPPDSTGKFVDTSTLDVGGNTVQRQRHVFADPTDPAGLAGVKAAAPGVNDYGQVTRPIVTDGYDANAGATTDAAVVADANGTMSGKLRGLVKILSDAWDSVNHLFRVQVVSSIPAGGNVIGHVITDNGSTTAVTGNVAVTSAGLTNLDVALSTRLKPADTLAGVTAVGSITNALPVGANIIGKVGIDPANNNVVLAAGANNIGAVAIQAGQTIAITGTVAANQLPAALGPQLMAGSLSVAPASDSTFQTIDDGALILTRLDYLGTNLSLAQEQSSGRLRVFLDPLGGAQTLGTVTTVTTVSTVTTVTAVTAVNTVVAFGPSGAGVDSLQTFIHQLWQESWAQSVGSKFT